MKVLYVRVEQDHHICCSVNQCVTLVFVCFDQIDKETLCMQVDSHSYQVHMHLLV